MNMIIKAVRQFAQDERGVTSIEYGLIAAVMALGIAASAATVRDAVEKAFTDIKNSIATYAP